MLRFAICDDESIICAQLEKMIEKISQSYSKKSKLKYFFRGRSCINLYVKVLVLI